MTKYNIFVLNFKLLFSFIRDFIVLKFYFQSIFINYFFKSFSKLCMNFHTNPNKLITFFFKK